MALKELIEIKFRLADGSDIGPNKYTPATTVGSLKEKIIAQWPKEAIVSYPQGFAILVINLLSLFDTLMYFWPLVT
ncbi:hypothetical protein MTR67_020461 [Solanum verrucosum]|uniref:UBL3-like ubiquitin domain-containing protein n=1 Tax=Solanum verrucosum TaxID=315347 RepID=A0AAF0QPI8_SOLVR|nr:hypothetical protein MTR67_020461 [Solanum verrucosum]